jgi:hypothetical protein
MAFTKPYAPNWVSAGGPFVTCGNVVFPQARFNHSAEIPHCVLNPPVESAERKKIVQRFTIKIHFSCDF